MSVRVLHVADVHLGAPLANFGAYAGRRRQELAEAFCRVAAIAIAERVHAVLIAGDLFDTWRPDPADVDLVRRELGRLREAGIKTFAVPGTHDSLAYVDCVYRTQALPFHRFFDGPTFADPSRLEIAGVPVVIYGIAYDRDRTVDGWASLGREREDGIHIALVHAACRSNPGWRIDPDDLPFAESELAARRMDYVALGHYHNLRIFRAGPRVVGAYSGSVLGRDWSEPGPRNVLVVEWVAAGDPPTVRPVPIGGRDVESRSVDVSGLTDPEAIAVAVSAACPPGMIWQVMLTGEPEIVIRPAAIEAALEPTHGHLRLIDETMLAASHRVTERCEEETVRGEFFRRLVAARETAAGDRDRAVAERAIKLGLRVFG
ncbi:MAG TPA: DNA repair exonuclease [Gemmatimonadota bacterium]|nr:DNA repair exonuclease [Gemmatimonadota bacterium]